MPKMHNQQHDPARRHSNNLASHYQQQHIHGRRNQSLHYTPEHHHQYLPCWNNTHTDHLPRPLAHQRHHSSSAHVRDFLRHHQFQSVPSWTATESNHKFESSSSYLQSEFVMGRSKSSMPISLNRDSAYSGSLSTQALLDNEPLKSGKISFPVGHHTRHHSGPVRLQESSVPELSPSLSCSSGTLTDDAVTPHLPSFLLNKTSSILEPHHLDIKHQQMNSFMIKMPIATHLPIVREFKASKLKIDDSRLSQTFINALNRESETLVHLKQPQADDRKKQAFLLHLLQSSISKVLPNSKLLHFNSSVHATARSEIDLDLILLCHPSNSPSRTALDLLANALSLAGMTDIRVIENGKLPLVRMRDPLTNFRCCFTLKPLKNTHLSTQLLFETYAKIDARFEQLCWIVKTWFARRIYRDALFAVLPHYAYVHMVIHLLQLRGVLPCLQELQKYVLDFSLFSDLEILNKYWKVGQNKEVLGELVMAFFKYFSSEFPYVHGAISIRTGGSISKDLKGWTREKQRLRLDVESAKDRFWFCVEDPFDPEVNICGSVDKETLYEIRGEFIRASKIICGPEIAEGHVLAALLQDDFRRIYY